MFNTISVNIIVNRERGCHNLLRGTISWLTALKNNYLPEGAIDEVLVACSKSEFVRTKKMLIPIKEQGIRVEVIPKENVDIDKAETRNNLMRVSRNNLILFLDPTILIGSTARLYIQQVVEGKLMKKSNEVLVTKNLKIGLVDLSGKFSSLHMLSTTRAISFIEPKPYQTINNHPLLFYNLYPDNLWIDYIPPVLRNAKYPERLDAPEKRVGLSTTRQTFVRNVEDEELEQIICSLSLDFSRISSTYLYLEDYIEEHTTIEPYHTTYKTSGKVYACNITLRYPNPYEIQPILKRLFYGSDAFMHYMNYRLNLYLSNTYSDIIVDINRRPRLYQYGHDEGLFDFPHDGDNSLFAEMPRVYDSINPKE